MEQVGHDQLTCTNLRGSLKEAIYFVNILDMICMPYILSFISFSNTQDLEDQVRVNLG